MLIYGGHEQAERCIALFFPEFMNAEEILQSELETDELIVCLEIEPKSGRFAKTLGHRDFLGALIGLGIERDQVGDILLEGNKAYAFVLSKMGDYIIESLSSVGSENVRVSRIPCRDCPASVHFEERIFTVSSLRLDLIVAGAFHLSRETAQKAIAGELVKIDSTEHPENATSLKGGERISLRGKGKIIFVGSQGESKKGKIVVKVLFYK